MNKIKVMFVCHGNICRSPIAEYCFKQICAENNFKNIEIASSATSTEEIGNDIYYAAKEVLDKNGITYEKRRARQMTQKDYEYYDYIIAMDDYNVYNLRQMFNDVNNKVYKLNYFVGNSKDISDPWYSRQFDECFNQIYIACDMLYQDLSKKEVKK